LSRPTGLSSNTSPALPAQRGFVEAGMIGVSVFLFFSSQNLRKLELKYCQ
jgi:hypothetical protein